MATAELGFAHNVEKLDAVQEHLGGLASGVDEIRCSLEMLDVDRLDEGQANWMGATLGVYKPFVAADAGHVLAFVEDVKRALESVDHDLNKIRRDASSLYYAVRDGEALRR